MKQYILASLSFLTLASCSGGGGGSSESTDPIYGEWYYEAPGATSTNSKGIIGKVSADGKLSFSYYYATGNTNSATFYVRNSSGTFTRTGDAFDVTYSYETCDPVNRETLYIKKSGDQLMVQNADKSVSYLLSKVTSLNVKNLAIIEDKNCTILSKREKSEKRVPANSKSTSFMKRFEKL